jgi:hypothetical protein
MPIYYIVLCVAVQTYVPRIVPTKTTSIQSVHLCKT